MHDTDTFLTTLYVMCDDFCKSHLASAPSVPGPKAQLCPAELLTLSLFSQFGRFPSEHAFFRFAHKRLRGAFPSLPDRSRFNRALRAHYPLLCAFFHHTVCEALRDHAPRCFEVMDRTAVVTRNSSRRGSGWLPHHANIGFSNRVGFFEGLGLLLSVSPRGVITGLALASASCKDQPLADSFLALRAGVLHDACGVHGEQARCPYLLDKGFAGHDLHQKWRELLGAQVICPRQRASKKHPHRWPKLLRKWHAGLRQIIETVNDKLLFTFGLDRERPHLFEGLQARVVAKAALHNFCIWLNHTLHRPPLAFADLCPD